MTNRKDLEEVYDTQISPLLQEIIDICKEHELPMMASFVIPSLSNPTLACSTCITDLGWEHADREQQRKIQKATAYLMSSPDGRRVLGELGLKIGPTVQ